MSFYQHNLDDLAEQTLSRCKSAQIRSRRTKIFSHSTALKLLRIELPETRLSDDMLHVCVPTDSMKSRMRGLVFHCWKCNFERVHRSDIWCVHPIDAWMQLAPYTDIDELVVLAENIMRSEQRIKPADFVLAAKTAKFHGKTQCEHAVLSLRSGADSSWETRLRLQLRHHRLPMPAVDYSPPGLYWDNGYRMRFDLAYPEHKVLIEYDGRHHFKVEEQGYRDDYKRSLAASRGWKVIIVDIRGMEMERINKTCDMVRDAIKPHKH